MKKHDLINEIIFTEEQILAGIKNIAEELNQKYGNLKTNNIVFLGILKGCLPFMFELIKHLKFDFKIDFMIVSSYFGGVKKESQEPKLILDADLNLRDNHIIIVEDIVETGSTLLLVKKHLQLKNPKSIKVTSLLYKKNPDYNNIEINPDWYALTAPQKFLVGFGLDYQEKLRNLQYIGTLKA